jgi:hypothetical protein
LATALRRYKSLQRLCLNSTRMTHLGLQVLCDAVVDHPDLIVFDVGMYLSTASSPRMRCISLVKYEMLYGKLTVHEVVGAHV